MTVYVARSSPDFYSAVLGGVRGVVGALTKVTGIGRE